MPVRIVFASDSHLNKHYGRMTPDQLATRRARLRAALGQTVDFAIDERAHLYVHGGDLFDGPNPRAVEIMWVAEQFQRLADAGVRTFLIGGNHDIPKTRHHGATPQRVFDAVRLAHTFTRPSAVDWQVVNVDGARVAIGGLPPDPRLGADDDPFALLTEPIEPPNATRRCSSPTTPSRGCCTLWPRSQASPGRPSASCRGSSIACWWGTCTRDRSSRSGA